MASRVTQVGRHVVYLRDETDARVTQLARCVLYPFTCEPGEPPPEPPPEEELPDCPAEIVVEAPPRTALEKFFRVHGPKTLRASDATADAQFVDFSAALGDTMFGALPLGGSGVRRRPTP